MPERLPSLRWWVKWLVLLALAAAVVRLALDQGTPTI